MEPKKAALVTGASRRQGIGAATCLELARAGFDIFYQYWTPYDQQMPWGSIAEQPHQLAEQIRALGRQCTGLELDLTAEEGPEHLLSQAFGCFAYLNVLVNNATHSTPTPLEAVTGPVLDRHYQLNIRATTLLCVGFAQRYQPGSGGRVINLVSGQELGPMPEDIAYALTKGAIQTLTHSLSPALMSRGLTINAVNPGPTDTGWMKEADQQGLLSRFPAQRVGLPQDAARIIAFLASQEAGWITGQTIHSEGGFWRS